MAFAGHLKSIDLHQSSRSGQRRQSSASANGHHSEKHELQQRLRLKALELEHLKSKLQRPALHVVPVPSGGSTTSSMAIVERGPTDTFVDDRGNAPTRSLWVGNTPHSITTSELRATFTQFGRIESTKCLKEYSFVNFEQVESAILALRECHEKELYEHGRPLWIRFTVTQAESRRTKESRLERRLSTTLGPHNRQEPSRSLKTGEQDGGRISGYAPPSEPRSHRRDISPPLLWRADTYRPTTQVEHDVYRPDYRSSSCDAQSKMSAYAGRISSRRRSCRSSSPSLSERSLASSGSRASSPWLRDSSPLPWERTSKKRKSSSHELLSGAVDLQDLATGLIKAPFTRSLCGDEIATHDKALDSRHENWKSFAPSTLVRSPMRTLPNSSNDQEPRMIGSYASSLTCGIDHVNEDQSPGNGPVPPLLLNHASLSSVTAHSPTFPTSHPSPFLHPNKRLRLDKDDSSSVYSERSSMSTSSDRDRKCRGCKKPGNAKGLHVLHKCSTCPRRYHGFCGRPKPNESVDKAQFTCGKCLRRSSAGRAGVRTHQEELASGKIQLASPPLSHHNNDTYTARYHRENIPMIDLGTGELGPPQRPYSPPSPTAPAKYHPAHSLCSSEASAPVRPGAGAEESVNNDHPRQRVDVNIEERHTAFESTNVVVNKYKTVTCPWWRNGGRCWLLEDDCLYAHRETDVLSPDGFQSNPKWTCYYWLRQASCPSGTRGCLYAHHDTGLHTSKDGKASLKHVTCFWWITRGICKHREEDCRYAHIDTGLYSRDPSEKRSGTAISRSRPRSWAICIPESRAEAGQLSPTKDPEGSALPSPSISASKSRPPEVYEAHSSESQPSLRLPTDKDLITAPPISGFVSKCRESCKLCSQGCSTSCIMATRPLTLSPRPQPEDDLAIDRGQHTTRAATTSQLALSQALASTGNKVAHMGLGEGQDIWSPPTSRPGERSLQEGSLPDDGALRNLGAGCLPAPSAATSNPISADPMRDPRRRLHSVTKPSAEHPLPESAGPSDVGNTESPTSTDLSAAAQIQLRSVGTAHLGPKAPTGNLGSSCKKCKVCAKTVFSSDACRDCRIGTVGTTKPLPHDGKDAENLDTTDQIAVDDGCSSEELIMPVVNAIVRSAHSSDELKPSRLLKTPMKRSSTIEDLFIPNKRPGSSMLFSSSRRHSTIKPSTSHEMVRAAMASETVRKPPPPTIHQLLERSRIENNSRGRTQIDISACRPSGIAGITATSQSDKENETPSAVEDLSPRSAVSAESADCPDSALPNEACSINIEISTTCLNFQEGLSDTALQGMATKFTNLLKDSKQEQPDPDIAGNKSPVQSSDQINRSDGRLSESSARPRIPFRCSSCAKTAKRCTHHGWIDDEAPGMFTATRSCDEPSEANPSLSEKGMWMNGQSTNIGKAVPHVCRNCRAHHKRCLHVVNGQRFDPIKCRQYLQDRGNKRDTSRSQIEWEGILEAAQPNEKTRSAIASPICDRNDRVQGEQSVAALERLRRRSESIPESVIDSSSDSEDDDGITNEKPLNWHLLQAFLHHPGSKGAVPKVDARVREDRLPTKPKPHLTYDRNHIRKLKEEGVMFESDEEEEDYDSDHVATPDLRGPILDPLRVPPKQSQDLFELCPRLHPRYPRRSNRVQLANASSTKISRKAEWAELRSRRLGERHQFIGNPHWEVNRSLAQTKVTALIERLIPALDVDINRFSIPSVERREEAVTFQDFLGVPRLPEASLTCDGTLAFKDGAKDCDQTSFARSARGFGRRMTDEDKFPIGAWGK